MLHTNVPHPLTSSATPAHELAAVLELRQPKDRAAEVSALDWQSLPPLRNLESPMRNKPIRPPKRPVTTILAVDDDANDLLLLEGALYPAGAGYKLLTAGNGLDAQMRLLQIIKDNADVAGIVIFSDVDMPSQDGFGFLKWLKEDPRLREIPVVMISSFDNRSNVNRAFELGAVACLVKPPDPRAVEGLLETIRRMNRRA